jgi:rubrerythrin
MGSTTTIYFEILHKFDGDKKTTNISILKRNDPHVFTCSQCDNTAQYIEPSSLCTVCDDCRKNVDESEGGLSTIVNSPRMGVCGYE